MSKYNATVKNTTKTINLAGGEAFKESVELELVSLVLTSFVAEQFYRTEKDSLTKLESLINILKDKKFIAKLAIYARNEFGMRSISHVIAGEIAKRSKNEQWTKDFFEKVIHRPDDMTEIMSYYISKFGKPIPNSLKKGLSKAFNKFDAYQLAKYRAEDKELSLVDLVNLVHPRPTPKNSEALSKLVKGELKSTGTWEVELTKAGQVAKNNEDLKDLKADAWKKLVLERKIGYFALLRNLRNIILQAPEIIDEVCNMLTDSNLITKSLVLPFRFSTAVDEIELMSGSSITRKVLVALDNAIEISCANVPKFDGETLVVLDCSGSMIGQPAKIGSLFAAVIAKANNADIMLFANSASYFDYNPNNSVSTIAKSIKFSFGGTNFNAIFNKANKVYDRVIILSDMQGWIDYKAPIKEFYSYKRRFNCNPFIFSFDLAGYGSLQFPESKIFTIAGFSDKVLGLMKLLEMIKIHTKL